MLWAHSSCVLALSSPSGQSLWLWVILVLQNPGPHEVHPRSRAFVPPLRQWPPLLTVKHWLQGGGAPTEDREPDKCTALWRTGHWLYLQAEGELWEYLEYLCLQEFSKGHWLLCQIYRVSKFNSATDSCWSLGQTFPLLSQYTHL